LIFAVVRVKTPVLIILGIEIEPLKVTLAKPEFIGESVLVNKVESVSFLELVKVARVDKFSIPLG
jgi:hypothetical protein